MSDILAALNQLEEEEAKSKAKSRAATGKSKKGSADIAAQNARKNAGRRSRAPPPRTPPPHPSQSRRSSAASAPPSRGRERETNGPLSPGPHLTLPQRDNDAHSERSISRDPESRRISFANTPRPEGNKIWIHTKSASLASGFEYDPRLNKYKVSEEEWKDFTSELVAAADVTGSKWLWPFRKKEVIKRIRRELQYDGDVGRVFKKWNKLFKQQRFQAWLELPGQKSDDPTGDIAGEQVVNVNRFRVVITPNSGRAPSVYSRNSSMTRSVTGEGVTAAMARKVSNEDMRST
eukprot:GHVU01088765.1.p1 GENE.GHVU01088765.1~~GHVU01088765.1.p1  ORF type:complete len:291 (+),score=29.52 GHVU01088765.1:52-924(+)